METNNNRVNPLIRVIGYIVLIIATAVGLWEMGAKFLNGPIDEGTTQLVPGESGCPGTSFSLGLSAGSFLISTLIYVFGVKQLEEAGPAALVQALGCLLLGGTLIVLDAGHPERMYMVLLYFNPTSVMAYMGLFYNVYIAIVVAEIYLVMRPGFVQSVQSGKRPTWLYRLLSLGSDSPGPEKFPQRPEMADDFGYPGNTRRSHSPRWRRHYLRCGQSSPQLVGWALSTSVYRFCSNLGRRFVDLPDSRFR